MRQTISGLVAAIAVVTASAVPAMACGYASPCGQPPVYVSPAPAYSDSGCGSCGGWARERLPDPVQQYYYADQGPSYTGPGNFAPYPTYQESAVSGWNAYRHHPYHYGYDGGRYADALSHRYDGAPDVDGPAIYSYRPHPHFRPWHRHMGYRYSGGHYRYATRHGYVPRFYPSPRSLRYGAPMGVPHHYGYREHVLRRYY